MSIMTLDFDDLKVERRDAIARITIDRPQRLNALAMPATRQHLMQSLEALEANQDIRAIVLTGAGDRAFCTGWDMETIGELNLAELELLIRDNLALFFKIWNQRQPVVAAINGYALGAGATMALVCDLAVAAQHAQLGEPEIRHFALSPFPVLPFLTHSKALHEYYYMGDPLGTEDMLRLGLVNYVVPQEQLEERAWALAERLASVPAYPLQMAKRSLRATYDLMGFSSAMRQHALADAMVIGADLPEQRALLDILASEGMRAFLRARDAPFKNTDVKRDG